MKRSLIITLLIAACMPLAAQEVTNGLKVMVENNRVSFNYTVSSRGQASLRMDGKAVVDGACYSLSGNGLEIYCDGTTKWTVDNEAKEVYIESSEGTRDFLMNPSAWMDKVTGLKSSGTTVSGTFEDKQAGQAFDFKFTSLASAPLSGSTEGFVFDASSLGSDWVVTDLR